jgi:simple sugar transport system substrate-binding protein
VSDHDVVHEAVERLEWSERNDDPTPQSRWREVTRRGALTGGAVGLTAFLLEACGGGSNKSSSSAQSGTPATGVFGEQSKLKFTFVNHVTTNPFFVPTKYGAEDACKLLGCEYQFTGSENSNVNEMVNAMNTAITGAVRGECVPRALVG